MTDGWWVNICVFSTSFIIQKWVFFLLLISFSQKPHWCSNQAYWTLKISITLANHNFSLHYYTSHYYEQIRTSINFPLTQATEVIFLLHIPAFKTASQHHPYRLSSVLFGLFNATFQSLIRAISDFHLSLLLIERVFSCWVLQRTKHKEVFVHFSESVRN